MGYFSNGEEGRNYESKYCDHCIHNQDDEKGCPVWGMHMLWNYEQGDGKDDVKKNALEWFIPRSDDGLENGTCEMFVADKGEL